MLHYIEVYSSPLYFAAGTNGSKNSFGSLIPDHINTWPDCGGARFSIILALIMEMVHYSLKCLKCVRVFALNGYWNANLPIKSSWLLQCVAAFLETREAFIWEEREKRLMKINIWLSDNVALFHTVNSKFVNLPCNECPAFFFYISYIFIFFLQTQQNTISHCQLFLSGSLKVIIRISPAVFSKVTSQLWRQRKRLLFHLICMTPPLIWQPLWTFVTNCRQIHERQ